MLKFLIADTSIKRLASRYTYSSDIFFEDPPSTSSYYIDAVLTRDLNSSMQRIIGPVTQTSFRNIEPPQASRRSSTPPKRGRTLEHEGRDPFSSRKRDCSYDRRHGSVSPRRRRTYRREYSPRYTDHPRKRHRTSVSPKRYHSRDTVSHPERSHFGREGGILPPKRVSDIILPEVLSNFFSQLPSRECFDGPTFPAEDLMRLIRNTIIPNSRSNK
jgi:hypothetical protein